MATNIKIYGMLEAMTQDGKAVSTSQTYDSTQDKMQSVINQETQVALGNKQDTLTFDNVPTQNSANPAKSGGIYSWVTNLITTLREWVDSTFAHINGWYSQLTVGFSENLIDTKGQGSEQEFTFRTSCGDESISNDGSAQFKKLMGNSIVWNELANPKASVSHPAGLTVTFSNGKMTIQGTSTRSGGRTTPLTDYFPLISGHKYYFVAPSSSTNIQWFCGTYNDSSNYDYIGYQPRIFTATKNIAKSFLAFNTPTGTITYDVTDYVHFIDLTLMFGAGNEPSTVKEFEALYRGYFAYNGGTIINNAVTAYETTGFNAYNPETGKANVLGGNQYQITGTYTSITLDGATITPDSDGLFTPTKSGELVVAGGNSTDTCVHLTWSGYRNGEYEAYWKNTLPINITTLTGKLNGEGESVVVAPDGLRGAGTAYDYGVIENGYLTKIVKVMGSVDLGSLTWDKTTGTYTRFSSSNSIGAIESNNTFNALASNGYLGKGREQVMSSVGEQGVYCYNSTLYIQDSSYESATAAAFKTAMNGVELIYELATPLTYVLDEPIPMIAPVADFGTEYAAPTGEVDTNGVPKSAPFRAVIQYGGDFTRELTNLPKNYDSTDGLDALCAQLASALSTALNGTFTITRGAYDESNKKYAWTVNFTPNS